MYAVDARSDRSAGQQPGAHSVDDRQRTLNPQVLGSNPRGRTHESPAQGATLGLTTPAERCTKVRVRGSDRAYTSPYTFRVHSLPTGARLPTPRCPLGRPLRPHPVRVKGGRDGTIVATALRQVGRSVRRTPPVAWGRQARCGNRPDARRGQGTARIPHCMGACAWTPSG